MAQLSKKPQKKNLPSEMKGVFSVGKNDIGYVRNKDLDIVVEIPKHHWNTALHRDQVKITLTNKKEASGEVIEILHRAKVAFAGTIAKRDDYYFLKPADNRDPEIIIPKNDIGTIPSPHEKVITTIDRWSDMGPIGHIDRILGTAGDNNVEMSAIALERGFDEIFPPHVLAEAEQLKTNSVPQSEIDARRDFRDILTFTIDPQDAKDFDDALSFQKLENGNYEIGIHIADVSYYVRPHSHLEKEAQRRTTSVYLVDRTIPMLPEVLSNDLCSLRPHEEKLTYSAVFEITPKAVVVDEWFGRTIIKSAKRFTYTEAQDIIDATSGEHVEALTTLNDLAKIMTAERLENGALNMDSTEVKFFLDENGKPLKVQKKHRIDTNRLIEEFMLLANKKVAAFMSHHTKRSIFVYRVHDKPDPERTQELRLFLKSLGYNVSMKNGVIPATELNALVREVDDHDKRSAIQTAIVRSMAKAIYATENIGHYGLGFTYYTHFTSPIRRYPDVMVHRLLSKCLAGEEVDREEFEEFERMVHRSSAREKDAQNAEWDSIGYKQVEYMSERIGEVFDGMVSGVNSKGIFVTERETQATGLVRLRDIPGDFWNFDEEKFIIKGKKTKKVYRVGDLVRIKVSNTDLKKGFIDYTIMPS